MTARRLRDMAQSLKVKVTVVVVLTGFVIFSITVYLSHQFTKKEFEKHYQDKAALIWEHITHDLEWGMTEGTHGVIGETLAFYRRMDSVKEARVFGTKGQETFMPDKGAPDPQVGTALKTGMAVSYNKALGGHEVLSSVIPLRNRPPCHRCHDSTDTVRGALLLSISTAAMVHDIDQQQQRFAFILGFVTVALIVISLASVNFLFLKPLERIQQGTEAIKAGDFNHRITLATGDEIGVLAEDFNRMAEKLRTLFEEINDTNTQLREQYRLVARSQREWQETFNSITEQIGVIDGSFTVTKANRAFREYFGITTDAGQLGRCHELFRTCFQDGCPGTTTCPHQRSMTAGLPVTEEVRDDNTGRILLTSFFPYASSDGMDPGSIYIAWDVTEKKENEMGLIMTERLAALGQMASGIAHELNNPLATIAACAEGLLKRVRAGRLDADHFESYLQIVDDEIMRCKDIITSMLTFVRPASEERIDVGLNEIMEKTLQLINFQGRLKEVELLCGFDDGLPPVRGNEGELRQVFLAVVVNALDAMGDQGTLTVRTGLKGDHVFVRVTDTGPGIPENLITRIFDPFFTTKSNRGGTGLGLSIADKIIRAHGGTISALSTEGQDTAIVITLPV